MEVTNNLVNIYWKYYKFPIEYVTVGLKGSGCPNSQKYAFYIFLLIKYYNADSINKENLAFLQWLLYQLVLQIFCCFNSSALSLTETLHPFISVLIFLLFFMFKMIYLNFVPRIQLWNLDKSLYVMFLLSCFQDFSIHVKISKIYSSK